MRNTDGNCMNQEDAEGCELGRDGSRRKLLALLGLLGLAGTEDVAAQDAAKINPRSYRVMLENDSVRVLEYRSLPGLGVCGQGKHFHPAHLVVAMSEGKAKMTTEQGEVIVGDQKSGAVFWEPAVTHSVENISGRPMRAYMVEIKDKDWKASTG
jgi:beta-alanine degradation protein BauB